MLGLVAYDAEDEDARVLIGQENRFTVNVLYRLGYRWPITDGRYLVNAISALDTMNFFDS